MRQAARVGWVALWTAGWLIAGCCKQVPEDRNRPGDHAGPRGEDATGDDDDSAADVVIASFVDDAERRERVREVIAPHLDALAPLEGYNYGPSLEGGLHGVDQWTLSLVGETGIRVFANRMESEEIAKSHKRFYKSGRIPPGSPTEQLGFVGLLATPGDDVVVDDRELRRIDAQGYWKEQAVEGVILDAACKDWPDGVFLAISAHAPKDQFDLAAAMPAIEALAVCAE
jgi:hypothetical protein